MTVETKVCTIYLKEAYSLVFIGSCVRIIKLVESVWGNLVAWYSSGGILFTALFKCLRKETEYEIFRQT